MKITLLAFGIAGEIIGASRSYLELPAGADVQFLRQFLSEKFPALQSVLEYAIAVNRSYVVGNIGLNENDEVAIIPPVSGG
ncbi:MAG: MoaD/ThiS family protein [Flavobacteriales bacterium]|jgi:molybdopterin synthase sulfur carrier subunit